ncbi:MAG TPA: PorV/PorQ family protein [Bacteroidota bacterium]|nr:PorV/PorQ family protein [Bacteroidota bacterium]
MKRLREQIHIGALMIAIMVQSSVMAQSKVGTTAAQFLGNSVGAKAIAMGSAFVASNDDVTGIYWNPGAFVQAKKSEFVFTNSEWLAGTKFRWFGLMIQLGDNALGLTLTQLDYGEDEVTTVDNPEGTGDRWSAADIAAGLSYSRQLSDRFSMGATVKYVSQRIYNETASSVTFDMGLLYVTDFHGMRLGMSMSNFGGDLTLSGRDLLTPTDIDPTHAGSNKTLVGNLKVDSWPMPLLFRVGLAMDVVKNDEMSATVAVDALRPSDNTESVNVGGEIGWRNMLFVRGGYKALFSNESVLNRNVQQDGLTLGAGLKYSAEGFMALEVNYAYTKFGLFGNLNTIEVALSF